MRDLGFLSQPRWLGGGFGGCGSAYYGVCLGLCVYGAGSGELVSVASRRLEGASVVTSLGVSVWHVQVAWFVVFGLPPGYPPRRCGVWIGDFVALRGGRWTCALNLAGEIVEHALVGMRGICVFGGRAYGWIVVGGDLAVRPRRT